MCCAGNAIKIPGLGRRVSGVRGEGLEKDKREELDESVVLGKVVYTSNHTGLTSHVMQIWITPLVS